MTAAMAENLVQANNLEMTFPQGQRALAAVDFGIQQGEFVSIVGPSGCGKSTLLRLIAGLQEATAGELTVADLNPQTARTQSNKTAFVFQDPNLLPWRNVSDNIRLPLELAGNVTAETAADIENSLDLIGLSSADALKKPSMLSGGMRMRVSLARALITEPNLLLLDEPFGALDDILRQKLNEDLLRIWQEQNWTGLFVTHNVAEAVFLSQRIFVMSAAPGTIASTIEIPFEFPRNPELRATAEFAKLTGEVSAHLRGTGE